MLKGMNVPQSAVPFEPPTLMAKAWHPSWLYEQALTLHSLTRGISREVMTMTVIREKRLHQQGQADLDMVTLSTTMMFPILSGHGSMTNSSTT